METIENLKNRLIDRIIVSKDSDVLYAIEVLLKSTSVEKKLTLSSQEIELLKMSEKDIENGRIISEEDLLELDSKWMDWAFFGLKRPFFSGITFLILE